jgi:pilus assembly protein FimV
MKFKLRIASAALLAMAAAPAWALQLGQIDVKSALNQPLVAAIPLHPKNLSELDGLTVGLASAEDFARAGLQLTPTDQTLRFHVVSDNNGQKLILVTSSQPVTDPYLDFLLQVNTRQGKQVREFVVLLNPVIAAPAPAVQTAPVAGAPAAAPARPAELPRPAALPPAQAQTGQPSAATPPPQPKPQPESRPQAQTTPSPAQAKPQPPAPPKPQVAAKPKAVAPPAPPAQAGGEIAVKRGDTLYGIATDASQDTGASINQMMIALKSANPEAFFKDNINDLRAGAILRIPTRDQLDKISLAEANAEVHRQYEAWRAAKPHPATVVEGTAAQAAARSAPKPEPETPASDHLTLVPASGGGTGTGSRPGVAGGTGSETVAGLQQRLHSERGTLASLEQSNADLESRVQSLKDIAGKSDKLLSFKQVTVAELQRKLADVQSGKPVAPAASAGAQAAGGARAAGPAPGASAPGAVTKSTAAPAPRSAGPWFERPLAWIVAGVIVVVLLLAGLLWRRRRGSTEPVEARGPLSDPEDVTPQTGTAAYAASLREQLSEDPSNLGTHLALCRLYHAQGDVARFVAAAEVMHEHVHDPGSMEWHEVAVMGEELAPGDPLFAAPGDAEPAEPHMDAGAPAAQEPAAEVAAAAHEPEAHAAETVPDRESELQPFPVPLAAAEPAPEAQPEPAYVGEGGSGFSDDPVDTKLDLARAYLDMGDPDGARAMLDEVIEEGSQAQQDEAKRLLPDATD